MSETESEFAASRRADYVRALNEEREMLERAGKKDRVKAVDAELARVSGKPAQRQEPSTQTTAAAPSPTAPASATPAKKVAAKKATPAKKVAAKKATPAKKD